MCRPIRCGCAMCPAPATPWWRCRRDAGDARGLPIGGACGQCRRSRCGRQARRRGGVGGGAGTAHSASASLAPEEGAYRLEPARRAYRGLAQTGPAGRLHQWLLDLLHAGKIDMLAGARAACDLLDVGVNGDAWGTRLKGQGPPVPPFQGAPIAWPRSKRSIWWWSSTRTRRKTPRSRASSRRCWSRAATSAASRSSAGGRRGAGRRSDPDRLGARPFDQRHGRAQPRAQACA